MKKYQLGALTVSDKGLQDTKEEVVIELIDRMQKYVAEGKAAYENGDYTTEQKLNAITNLCGRFCGLVEFLQITMGVDVRRADGLLYTQEKARRAFWLNVAKYAALTVAGILLFRAGAAYALAERGYKAIGGEVFALFLPVFFYIASVTVRDWFRDIKQEFQKEDNDHEETF